MCGSVDIVCFVCDVLSGYIAVGMSLRLLVRFSTMADSSLWLKRFKMYTRHTRNLNLLESQCKTMVRDKFICSSNIYLKLMLDKPSSLEEELKWANQLVETEKATEW